MKNNKGFVLVAALMVMLVLSILGPAFLTLSLTETQIAFNDRNATRALYVAEMGVERARRDLKYDADFDRDGITNQYFASPTPVAGGAPADCSGTIIWQNLPPQQRCYDFGMPIPPSTFQTLYTNANVDTFGDGSAYTVQLGQKDSNRLTIRSEGTGPQGSTKVVDVRVEVRDLSVWGNAAFLGGTGTGARINGNVVIAGSVHILGEGLGSTGVAADFGGSAGIFNWYNGLNNAMFAGRIPNTNPSTLDAEIRVKEGRITMNSGSARVGTTLGDLDIDGNPLPLGIKLRVDGSYANYGYGGTYADTYVYADNGTSYRYDVPPDQPILFPSLTGPSPDPCCTTYEEYLDTHSWDPLAAISALGLANSPVSGTDLTLYQNTDSFDVSWTDPFGFTHRLAWNKLTNILIVEGIIRIPGTITLGGTTGPTKIETIHYTTGLIGGTLYAKEAGGDWDENGTSGSHQISITINCDLIPVGVFPTGDRLGLIAKDRIYMTRSQKHVAAAVYAENQIKIDKQYQVVGAVVSKFLDMGSQVPRLYQMPNLVKNLPPGMPGGDIFNFVKILSWREL